MASKPPPPATISVDKAKLTLVDFVAHAIVDGAEGSLSPDFWLRFDAALEPLILAAESRGRQQADTQRQRDWEEAKEIVRLCAVMKFDPTTQTFVVHEDVAKNAKVDVERVKFYLAEGPTHD